MQLFLIHFPYDLHAWESLLCRNLKIKVCQGRWVPYLPTHVVLLHERCSTLLPPTFKNHLYFNFNPLRDLFQKSRYCHAKVEFNSINLVRHGSSTTFETRLSPGYQHVYSPPCCP